MSQGYPIVPFEDEGKIVEAYRVDLNNGMILLVPKAKIDLGLTTLEAEIKFFKESLR